MSLPAHFVCSHEKFFDDDDNVASVDSHVLANESSNDNKSRELQAGAHGKRRKTNRTENKVERGQRALTCRGLA